MNNLQRIETMAETLERNITRFSLKSPVDDFGQPKIQFVFNNGLCYPYPVDRRDLDNYVKDGSWMLYITHVAMLDLAEKLSKMYDWLDSLQYGTSHEQEFQPPYFFLTTPKGIE